MDCVEASADVRVRDVVSPVDGSCDCVIFHQRAQVNQLVIWLLSLVAQYAQLFLIINLAIVERPDCLQNQLPFAQILFCNFLLLLLRQHFFYAHALLLVLWLSLVLLINVQQAPNLLFLIVERRVLVDAFGVFPNQLESRSEALILSIGQHIVDH